MTDKKFTDEEIKKALEICAKNTVGREGYFTYQGIPLRYLCEDALDLINRYEAEIERLKEEKLQVVVPLKNCGNSFMVKDAKTIRTETIKEFAERLKDFPYKNACYTFEGVKYRIDTLVKEMTGETKTEKCDCFCEEQRIKGWLDGNTPITEPITVCNGTRERDECTCGGNKSKCDFYAKDYSYGY